MKGILNNKLREHLMLHEPAITTRDALKQIVQNGQTGLLKFARTFNNPPAAVTAGLGALQRGEDLETEGRPIVRLWSFKEDLALAPQIA